MATVSVLAGNGAAASPLTFSNVSFQPNDYVLAFINNFATDADPKSSAYVPASSSPTGSQITFAEESYQQYSTGPSSYRSISFHVLRPNFFYTGDIVFSTNNPRGMIWRVRPDSGKTISSTITYSKLTPVNDVNPALSLGSVGSGKIIVCSGGVESSGSNGISTYDTDTTSGSWSNNSSYTAGSNTVLTFGQSKITTSTATQVWNVTFNSGGNTSLIGAVLTETEETGPYWGIKA